MSIVALSKERGDALGRLLAALADECEAQAVVVCDTGGNILAQESHISAEKVETVAALAAGSFAATKELATVIGEPGFKAIFHRGQKSGILIQALGNAFMILILFGETTIEGLVRLCVKRVGPQLESLLTDEDGNAAIEAGTLEPFEVKEGTDPHVD